MTELRTVPAVDVAPPKKQRRKKSVSPTQRTMAELRARGWTAQIVERRVPRVNILRDLFGFGDIVALVDDGILAIQCTSGDHHAHRREKILAEPRALEWLRAGGKIAIWSWEKQGARGKRKTWQLREEEIEDLDFAATQTEAT